MIKGRASKGNLLTKFPVHRIGLKSHGHSTLGGRKVWYDPDVNRLNYDDHGRLLGEFFDDDQILVILKNGDYYLSNFDLNNHYEENILRIEKYDTDKIWTAILYDADNQNYPYIKRFQMDASKKKQNWLSENYPRIQLTYGGADEFRGSEEIDAEQFIAVKGYKAKGKRLTTYCLESVVELEPTRFPEEEETSIPSIPSRSSRSSIPSMTSETSETSISSERGEATELSLFDHEE